MSLITCMLTIYCGLFYLSDNPEVYKSSDSTVREADNGCKCPIIFSSSWISLIVRLDETTKWFFFVVIGKLFSQNFQCQTLLCFLVGCNASFLLFWCFKMMGEIKDSIRQKWSKFYICCFLCGNKRRFEEEKFNKEICKLCFGVFVRDSILYSWWKQYFKRGIWYRSQPAQSFGG